MLKKLLCILLSIGLLKVASLAQATSPEVTFKTKIVNWGLEKNVTVKLKTGEQVKGHVTEIKDEFFVVQTAARGTTRQVKFQEIDTLTGHIDWGAQKTRNYLGLVAALGLATYLIVNLTRSRDREPKPIIFSPR
jgi:small nuclear ribonucleoprotein (snRNP)-like protein